MRYQVWIGQLMAEEFTTREAAIAFAADARTRFNDVHIIERRFR